MQRTKGKVGEREVASIVRELTGWDVRRRVRQHDGDSDLEGVPGWSVEVKRRKKAAPADIKAWWKQAVEQSDGQALPVLFFREDRCDWRAVWPIGPLLTMQHVDMWSSYDYTSTGSVSAWAAVARELMTRLGGDHAR